MGKVVGEELNKWVIKQINTRQDIHGKQTRSVSDLEYLNSKTTWIKLASGVNVSSDRIIEEGIINELSNESLSKQRILFSGTSRLGEAELTQRSGIYDKLNGAYNLNNKLSPKDLEFGLVPMPGIESAEIQCMNRGSIKKATIKIKAYNREQFQFIDLLYLRLGYTVLLEWGNSVYLDNNGNVQTMGPTLIETDFFNYKGSFNDFLPKLSDMRSKYRGNYDGILAKIVNFDWTFTTEGIYDINIQLITQGDIVESLKTNLAPESKFSEFINVNYKLYSEENDISAGSGEENTLPSPSDNMISSYMFLYKLYASQIDANSYSLSPEAKLYLGLAIAGPAGGIASLLSTIPSTNTNITVKLDGNEQNLKGIFIDLPSTITGGSFFEGPITFNSEQEAIDYANENYPGSVLIASRSSGIANPNDISNDDLKNASKVSYVIGNNKDVDEFYLRIGGPTSIEVNTNAEKKDVFYLNYNNSDDDTGEYINEKGFYMRFGHLLSYIQDYIIPKSTPGNQPIVNLDYSTWSNRMYLFPFQISLDPRVCLVNAELNNITAYPEIYPWKNESKGYAWTMNIYLNFNQIQASIDENKDENGNVALMPFLESICVALNKALGGVNNLEPIIDEETNTIHIIDGSYSSEKTPTNPYEIEVFGYNGAQSNFVRSFDLKTSITPEYASMVTVGSTAGGYVKGTENTMFSKWNKGITDRFKTELIPGSPQTSKDPDEPLKNYNEGFWTRNLQALGYTPYDIDSYDPFAGNSLGLSDEIIDKNIATVTEFYKYCHKKFQEKYPNYGSPTNGFIPFSLGLTLDGISGMKIYNEIKVSTRFLPFNYPKSLRFIIKGINHKISNQDWETTIETVVIPQNQS